jgi:hypothetical protein
MMEALALSAPSALDSSTFIKPADGHHFVLMRDLGGSPIYFRDFRSKATRWTGLASFAKPFPDSAICRYFAEKIRLSFIERPSGLLVPEESVELIPSAFSTGQEEELTLMLWEIPDTTR